MLIDRMTIENALPHNPPSPIAQSPIAHYTRIDTLCHFVPSGATGWASAWATPVQFLNDRLELTHGLNVLLSTAKKLASTKKNIVDFIDNARYEPVTPANDAFQMSFSEREDDLGQWRGYAANGMGCSVVTSSYNVWKAADIAGWVLYDDAEQERFSEKILASLQNEAVKDKIEQTVVAAACFMKHSGFATEKEFRLLKFPLDKDIEFRGVGDRLVPYTDYLKSTSSVLPIHKIWIGPGWQLLGLNGRDLRHNHVVLGINRLLSARNPIAAVDIEPSKIPYDPK